MVLHGARVVLVRPLAFLHMAGISELRVNFALPSSD